jgi:hypothetical protein
LRGVIKELSKEKRIYTLNDIIAKLDDDELWKREDERRIATIKMCIKDLSDEGVFTCEDLM